jgi:hypothetical protein
MRASGGERLERCEIGIGGASPLLPCHTTGHAVRIRRFGRIKLFTYEQLGKPK